MGLGDHWTNTGSFLGGQNSSEGFSVSGYCDLCAEGTAGGAGGGAVNTPQTQGDLILPLAMPQINSHLQVAKLGFFHPYLFGCLYMATVAFVGGRIQRPGRG